jgi:zinc transport system substrate-binding protein
MQTLYSYTLIRWFALCLVVAAGPALGAPKVVASIKPLHSLVAMVMAGVGEPRLLVRGAASPHAYALRPSDAAALQAADIVFWTGHGMEVFLEDSLDTLAPRAAHIDMSATPGLTLLPLREGGTFEAHADEGADAHHDERDMHFFLDPENARAMLTEIASALSAADPANAATYLGNAAEADKTLAALESTLAQQLRPLAGRPFVVFHDAYQYFEARFGLSAVGSITVSADLAPGAERVSDIRTALKTLNAACVFAEPQFDAARVAVFLEGTSARAGTLDPEGAALNEGPGLYPALVQALADGLTTCLSAAGP